MKKDGDDDDSDSKHGRKKKREHNKKKNHHGHKKHRKHHDHKHDHHHDDEDLKCHVDPPNLLALPRFNPLCSSRTRSLLLSEGEDEFGRPMLLIDDLPFEAPVNLLVPLGAEETWSFINTTPDVHPMHIHLVRFHVVSRRPFNVSLYQAALDTIAVDNTNAAALATIDAASSTFPYTGPAMTEDPTEIGWKDTVKVR